MSGADQVPSWLQELSTVSLVNWNTASPDDKEPSLSTANAEHEVIDTIATSCYAMPAGSYHGMFTTGGSSSNFHALLYARERWPEAKVFTCSRAHFSVKKACHLLRMTLECAAPQHAIGGVDIHQLVGMLKAQRKHVEQHGAVVVLTQGYTFGGATDHLGTFLAECARQGIPRGKLHIHIDAAFGGMFAVSRGFARQHALGEHYESICLSGQKFFGCPAPCSLLIASQSAAVSCDDGVGYTDYIKSRPTALEHSRSGWPALFLKHKLETQKVEGLLESAASCLDVAKWLATRYGQTGSTCHYFGEAPCVVFDTLPSTEIIDRYTLMTVGDQSQVICMPHVQKPLLKQFLNDMDLDAISALRPAQVTSQSRVAQSAM
eukprot:gnl/TRDRNA2_/TRDRNA2_172136_c0_seq2.p1 gnl/TRDRNA2_/TRDRNA2_172136_c0~~gnl/TRDRNA2_/TRDRNA2_172136_c0_seq2.p1  ORF type:complete len:437 (+),score=50.77 gnl/TRDRNA2_/TRDRNA2_172136_c0_seq2:186-1313(+)